MDKKDFFRAEKEATSPKLTGRKASNGGMTSPTASGAVPLNGALSAAPATTNSPAPSLDALTNSVGSDQGQRMFPSQNSSNSGQLTNASISDTHNSQIMSSQRIRQRTPSTVSNSSTPYSTYDQTRLTNPTPPPRTAASISNNTMQLHDPSNSNNNSVTSNIEGNYNLTHHMPQSNFPHFQGLAHIRGPVEGFGFSSHLLGHSEDDKANVLDNSCNNVTPINNRNNYSTDNNINNYAINNIKSSGVMSSKCITTVHQGSIPHNSNKRGSTHRRVQNQNQSLHDSHVKNLGPQHENQRGMKNSDQNNASIWYGGSQDYNASPPLSNVATAMPSYMFLLSAFESLR